MRRTLILGAAGAIAAGVLVPAAMAAPKATHTVNGTVVAKDKAHHALVVARAGGAVQTVVAPQAFAKTSIGRRVVVRFTTKAGALAIALAVTPKGVAHTAVVHGTIVKLGKQRVVLNAGGSLLKVKLVHSTSKRQLASAKSGPGVGDEVEAEVEIGTGGALGTGALVDTSNATVGGELSVRGKVAAFTAPSATTAGSITVTSLGISVTCAIAAGKTVTVATGDAVALDCVLIGDPGVWTAKSITADSGSGQAGAKAGSGSFTGTPVAGSGKGSGDDDDEDDEDDDGEDD